LHKYLYCHGNPVMSIDPTGQFSITEVSVNMAIQSIGIKIFSPIIKPAETIFTQGLIKGLLPFDILDQLNNARLSAVMFGGSISGVAAKGLAVGFGGGLEVLYSPFTNTAGLYGYSEWVIGVTRARSGAMGVAKAGLVFKAPRLSSYEGSFRSITFPIRRLPKRVREAIIKRFTLTPWEAMTLPKVGNLQAKMQGFYNKAKILPKMIDGSTQCSIFYTPGTHGPFGISITKVYLPGNAGLIAFGMQYYKLLLGDSDARLY